ncbi:relaxase/mobilization nuclease domain-containing protein [Massilibacteroides vaginae]|uniref:relaxase/mobilization nuclease domain-containing protein n=1 Tax=Massilibacteroides vaginae TaxID=1673718 RepID=UPI000A1CB85C|nr:relaxase/mobilization nuclease domain-containing protein [Massilibacteroides vaginae]
MVAKINTGSSLYGALQYNQEKVDRNEALVLFSKGIIHDESLNYNVRDSVQSFDLLMITNKRTKKPVVHISLNPDLRDQVDDETAKEIAQEYLDKMGYGKQPYLLYKHNDIDRTHYHIVTVCVDENGDKINDSYSKRRSMEACREIEKKYNLYIPTKIELKNEYRIKPVDHTKGDLAQQIKNSVGALIQSYNFTSFAEYKTLLEQFGCTYTHVDGRIPVKDTDKFKPIHGIFYSAIDENKGKNSRQLKSSIFGKEFGYEALQKKIKSNEKKYEEVKIKEDRPIEELTEKEQKELKWKKHLQKQQQQQKKSTDFTRRVIVQCMYQCKNRSTDELSELLKKRGVDMILFRNKDNLLYGVTFIDHNTRSVLKGSRLGDVFSANRLANFFDNPHFIIPFPNENKGNEYTPTKEKESQESIFDFFSMPEYADPDETIKRKKKKKNKPKF